MLIMLILRCFIMFGKFSILIRVPVRGIFLIFIRLSPLVLLMVLIMTLGI